MGAYDVQIEKCPYCGAKCTCDMVDVGVGLVQCGPFHCEECTASEIRLCDKSRKLTKKEKKTG